MQAQLKTIQSVAHSARNSDIQSPYYGFDRIETDPLTNRRNRHNSIRYPANSSSTSNLCNMENKINIRTIGVCLFVGACIFCIYGIFNFSDEKSSSKKHYLMRLKLVNIFNRHGDRSPGDALPKVDRHLEKPLFFWPNGLSELTETGKFRQLKIGLETRRKYGSYLDYDSSKVLAFSSPVSRCKESLELILKGLYDLEWIKAKGQSVVNNKNNCTNCVQNGSGSPDEWRKIKIDTQTVPSLTYEHLNNCSFRKQNPSPIDSNLLLDPDISSLKGINRLKEVLKKKYDQDLNFTTLGLWSTIATEMTLIHTESTIEYTNHYSDWVNEIVYKKHDSVITLFDLYEQMTVIAYRDRVVNEANYIQSGPIITSLIESQLVALGQNVTNNRVDQYKGKKMILYSSHDSILQVFLNTLGLVQYESTFEQRFERWHRSHDEVGKFLSGLKMSSFGMSVRFELWDLELERKKGGKIDKFPIVQVSIYNSEEVKFRDIDYKQVEFGSACRRLFKKKYPLASANELAQFYDKDFQIDIKQSCPFALLRNITANLMIDETKDRKLCGI